jgi:hypothetical protein
VRFGRAFGRPFAVVSQYQTANVTTVLTQISTASTSTEKADAPLPDKVVTRKTSRSTREAVTKPSSTKEIVRASRWRPRACAVSKTAIDIAMNTGSQKRGKTLT